MLNSATSFFYPQIPHFPSLIFLNKDGSVYSSSLLEYFFLSALHGRLVVGFYTYKRGAGGWGASYLRFFFC
jgi:hypothetical protein